MSNSSSETTAICANCGKGEEAGINLKACTACKMVKYCNRDCQIAHRPQHKKQCKKKAKELHNKKLFEQPQQLEDDCPICMIRLPTLEVGSVYMTCCGKVICRGCTYAFQSRAALAGRTEEDDICPFCRTPNPTADDEIMKRYEKRVELNDAEANYVLGTFYARGDRGLPQNFDKALELWHRAAKLGFKKAYFNIAHAYRNGRGVERDEKQALQYTELSAMGGHVTARYNLGAKEANSGNMDRALRHFLIAVKDGDSDSLKNIKRMYMDGHAKKDDYMKALSSYQIYLEEIKSDQRDEAAAFDNMYRYYASAV